MIPLALFLQLAPASINLGRDLVRAWRKRRGDPGIDWSRYAPGTEPIAPLPQGWERWNGARPEPRGAPRNTLLNVRGLAKMTPEFRAKLLDLCEEFGVPIDSMVTIISNESAGFNPSAENPLPAAGLIQLTTGANLEGFKTKDAIRAVLAMSAEEQIDRVIRPYYARLQAARGANPGHLYMLNFLPEDANQREDFKLGSRDDKDSQGKLTWRGKVYKVNAGFDPEKKKGYFTIGDVYAVSASICRGAKGRRITVDGRILEPPFGAPLSRATGPAAAAAPAPPAAPSSPAPARPGSPPQPSKQVRTTGDAERWVFGERDAAGGLLLRAVEQGRLQALAWVSVQLEDLLIEVTSDALRAPLAVLTGNEERLYPAVRLPVNYTDQIRIARALGAVSPTVETWIAAWTAAPIKVQPKALPADKLMGSVGRAVIHSANVDAYEHRDGVLIRDVGKGWILHPRLAERGAVNYGWIRPATGQPIQSVGGRHDAAHYDYSQTCVLVRRAARDPQGRSVDLLDYLETKGIARRWLDVYR